VPTPARSKQVDFSIPFFFIPYLVYGRVDETRFRDGLAAVNTPATKIAVIDGEFAYEIVKRDFPKAALLTLPPLSDGSQVMLSVTTNKADIFLNDSAAAAVFMQKNPGKIKAISNEPLRTLAAVIALPQDDVPFKIIIETTLSQLINDRFIDGVLAKYALKDSNFLLPAKPYREIK
jgi:ABC-type amino acid transport substrate-binding protein